MGIGPQESLDIIFKHFKNASNKAVKGHFVDQKQIFKRKAQLDGKSKTTLTSGSKT